MKKQFFLSLALAMTTMAYAQYPQLTEEGKAHIAALKAKAKAHSDSAWAVAEPIVLAEAKEGRPYIPWAYRPYDLPQAKIPSFPGAEGGGMYTFGGRGGKVLTVTNLNDDGPGSFRWACEQGGARIVVFNVSGIIRLKSNIDVRAPYITIAGQTAPGEGVVVTGASFQVNTHDVIVRHMRFRRGETTVLDREDSFGGNPVGNIMIDHCSCSWGGDENISFYRHMYATTGGRKDKLPTVNVTIQNTITAKCLDTWNHAFGSTIGGENVAFMRNLWASNTGRNPSCGWGGVFNFMNNVVFNWVHRTCDGGDYKTMFNMVNNYYKPGPATPKEGSISHRILRVERRKITDTTFGHGRVFAEGNIVEGNERVTKNNWDGGIQPDGKEGVEYDIRTIRSNVPFAMPEITILPSDQVYEHVLANVGATLPVRDVVDQRIIEEVRSGKPYYVDNVTEYGDMWGLDEKSQNEEGYFKHRRMGNDSYKLGIITHPSQMGGQPEYKKAKPYKDSDMDGMPDEWEKKNGLNPNDPSDANGDMTGDGYTNIEKYINSIGQ